jgi:hypothetical protein
VSLKDKKGVNDLMHVSLNKIQMLTTFDKDKLLLLYDNNHCIYFVKEINILFFQMCIDVLP